MATITSILNRISELTSRNGKNSIGKNDMFGLLTDMVKRQQSTELNMSNVSIRKIYASIAAMNADVINPIGDDNDKIRYGQLVAIENENSLDDSGKLYRYSVSAWEYVGKIGDLAQKADKDSVNDLLKKQIDKNKFNPSDPTIEFGYYWESTNGMRLESATSFNILIKCKPDTDYVFTIGDEHYCFLDSNKSYISGLLNSTTFKTPVGCYYIRISTNVVYLGMELQLEEGIAPTLFERYREEPSDFVTTIEKNKLIQFSETKTANLFNKNTVTPGKYANYANGNLDNAANYCASDFIEILPGTSYSRKYADQMAFYNSEFAFISGALYDNTIFSPLTAKYMRISTLIANIDDQMLVKGNSIPTVYINPTVKIVENINISRENVIDYNEQTIIVKSSGTKGVDCDFSGNNAIKEAFDSIIDASQYNRYKILATGLFKAESVEEYIAHTNTSFIDGKPFVSLIGIGGCVIDCSLPDNLGVNFNYGGYQSMWWHSSYGLLKDVKVFAKNLRYAIHIDGGPTGNSNYITNIEECHVEHRGNSNHATNWVSCNAIGVGMSQGMTLSYLKNTLISWYVPVYAHNAITCNKSAKIEVKNSQLINPTYDWAFMLQNMGSTQKDELIIENNNCCGGFIFEINSDYYGGGTSNRDVFKPNRNDFKITGHGNSKMLFTHRFDGKVLRITGNQPGLGKKIELDTSSTAFDFIFKSIENNLKYDFFKYHFDGGYLFVEGFTSLKPYTLGQLDVSEQQGGGQTYCSLGKRLGNCSVVNKILTVVVDGITSINVVFNKNYDGTAAGAAPAYSNAQIIAEINDAIAGYAICDEYCFSNEYYPELSDVNSTEQNTSGEDVLSGMAVVKIAGRIRKATSADKFITGIAIDDIPNKAYGRIIKNCYISTNQNIRFFAKITGTATCIPGDKFLVSATPGLLEKNANGFINCFSNDVIEL